MLLLSGASEKLEARVGRDGRTETQRTRKGMSEADVRKEAAERGDVPLGRMLRYRVRYFTDGAVIGSRVFVNEVFARARERFGPRRKDGARKLRERGAAAAGMLWSVRDLRKGIG